MPNAASLLVIYDYGSLPPVRIAEAAEQNGCEAVFVAGGSAHSREMLPVLEMLGTTVDTAEHSESELIRVLQRQRPAGIVTFSESQIAPTTRLAAALGLPYHDAGDLDAIIRKDRQRQRFHDKGIDTLRFREITTMEEIDGALAHVGLPAVIKPTTGASSKHTTSVTTEADCRAAVAGILHAPDGSAPDGNEPGGDTRDGTASAPRRSVIMEEMLVGRAVEHPWGDYIAVDCVATGDGVRPLFVTSKFELAKPFRERGGYGQTSVLEESQVRAAQEEACRAVEALNIRRGIADVELKLTDDGPRVIEVNGRLGGWVDDLAIRSGSCDPADIAVKAAVGLPFEPPPAEANGQIAFHYLVMPPVTATRVRAVREDLFSLRERAGVDVVSITTGPGASADWRIGADSGVAAVLGTVEKHEQLAEIIQEIESVDWIDYD